MKKSIIVILVSMISIFGVTAQDIDFDFINEKIINLGEVANNSEDFAGFSALKEPLKNVEIIMLGEQSHGEATTYETKIKLIKYLHQELGFDLLLFESGFYDCHKAWQLIEQGDDVRDAMGRSIFHLWSTTKDLKPLAQYLETMKGTDNELKLLGFDNQFSGKLSQEYFISDLSNFLKKLDPSIIKMKEWKHMVENFGYVSNYKFKKLKKNNPEKDTAFISQLISKIEKSPSVDDSDFWIQALKNAKVFLSDLSLKTDGRDKQMAQNLFWLKEKYPNSKIICWGATSHFLYNSTEVRMKNPIIQTLGGKYYKKHPMMGHYVKEVYGDKLYTVGFTAYEGKYGLFRRKKIKPAKIGTLEFLLSQSNYDNFLLPLKDLNFTEYKARPLGNFYMKNDISTVMDAVIFNRNMVSPRLDRNFFLSIYPENKYIKPEVENLQSSLN